eukprot:gene7540-8141_t
MSVGFYGIVLIWIFLLGIQSFLNNPRTFKSSLQRNQIESSKHTNNHFILTSFSAGRVFATLSSTGDTITTADIKFPSLDQQREERNKSSPYWNNKRPLTFTEGKFSREDYKYLEIYFGMSSIDTDVKSQELYARFREIYFSPKITNEAVTVFVDVLRAYLEDVDAIAAQLSNRILATKMNSVLFIYDRLAKKIQKRKVTTLPAKNEVETQLKILKGTLQAIGPDSRPDALFKPLQNLLFRYFDFQSLSYFVQNRILELKLVDGDINLYLLGFYRCVLKRITFLEDFAKTPPIDPTQPIDETSLVVRNFRAKNILLGKLVSFIGVSQQRFSELPDDILSMIRAYVDYIHDHNYVLFMSRTAIEDLFFIKNDYYLHLPRSLQRLQISVAPGGKAFQRIYSRFNPALIATSNSSNAPIVTNPFFYNSIRGLGDMGLNGYDFSEEQILAICHMTENEIRASQSLPVRLQYFYSLYSMYFFEMSNQNINRRLIRLFFEVFPFSASTDVNQRQLKDLSRSSFAMILHIFGDIFSVVKLEKEKGKWTSELEKELFGERFDGQVFLAQLYDAIPLLFARSREKTLFEILTIFHQMEVRWANLPQNLQDFLTKVLIELLPNFAARGDQLFDVIYLISSNLFHPDSVIFNSPLYQTIISSIKTYFTSERVARSSKQHKDMLKHYLFTLKFLFRKTQDGRESNSTTSVATSSSHLTALDNTTQDLLGRNDQELLMASEESSGSNVEDDDKHLDSSPLTVTSDQSQEYHKINPLTPAQALQREVFILLLPSIFNESLRQQTLLTSLISETAALWKVHSPVELDDPALAIFQSPSNVNRRFSKYKYESLLSYTSLIVAIVGNTGMKLGHKRHFPKKLHQLLSQYHRYVSKDSPKSLTDVLPVAFFRSLPQIFYGLRHFSIPYYRLPPSLRRLFLRSMEDMHTVVDKGWTYTTILSFLSYLNDYDRRRSMLSYLFELRYCEKKSRTAAVAAAEETKLKEIEEVAQKTTVRWTDLPHTFRSRVISMIYNMIDSNNSNNSSNNLNQTSEVLKSSSMLYGLNVFSPVISVTCDSHPYAIEVMKSLIYLNRLGYFEPTSVEIDQISKEEKETEEEHGEGSEVVGVNEEEFADSVISQSPSGSNSSGNDREKWGRAANRALLHKKMVKYLREAAAVIEAKPVSERSKNEENFISSEYLTTLTKEE